MRQALGFKQRNKQIDKQIKYIFIYVKNYLEKQALGFKQRNRQIDKIDIQTFEISEMASLSNFRWQIDPQTAEIWSKKLTVTLRVSL